MFRYLLIGPLVCLLVLEEAGRIRLSGGKPAKAIPNELIRLGRSVVGVTVEVEVKVVVAVRVCWSGRRIV